MQNHKMIHRICKKKLTLISIIFLVHLCLVLLFIPWFVDHYPKLYQINSFPDGYDKVATNLIDGRGYRLFEETSETVMRPPAYVFFHNANLYKLLYFMDYCSASDARFFLSMSSDPIILFPSWHNSFGKSCRVRVFVYFNMPVISIFFLQVLGNR
jgi:hypothetical protein